MESLVVPTHSASDVHGIKGVTSHDAKAYPNLLALLEARRTLCKPCRLCGYVNAAWGTAAWTQDHPSCRRVAEKRLESLATLKLNHREVRR